MAESDFAWGVALFSALLFFYSYYDKMQLKGKVKQLEHYQRYASRIDSIDREESLLRKNKKNFNL